MYHKEVLVHTNPYSPTAVQLVKCKAIDILPHSASGLESEDMPASCLHQLQVPVIKNKECSGGNIVGTGCRDVSVKQSLHGEIYCDVELNSCKFKSHSESRDFQEEIEELDKAECGSGLKWIKVSAK